MKIIIILFSIVVFTSCKSSSSNKNNRTPIFDPTADNTDGTTSRIPGVLNLAYSISTSKNVTLTWYTPSVFSKTNSDYKIYVYRIEGDGITTPLPDPAEKYSQSDYYFPTNSFQPFTQSNQYSDATELTSGGQYTYYVYIKEGDNWSGSSKITLTVGGASTSIGLPTATSLWPSYKQSFGMKPVSTIYNNTLSPGLASSENPTGGCALAEDGGLLYCADTDNNRVVIYQSNSYQMCSGLNTTNTADLYTLCMQINKDYPLLPLAVLGQKDFASNYPCGHQQQPLGPDSCFTKPRSVMVADGHLFVSDSGNNRIMIHSTLPTNGCYSVYDEAQMSVLHQCSFISVVGKKSLTDLSSYPLASFGNSSLKNPTSLAYKPSTNKSEGDLYIADTGNNRVVVARKVLSVSYWSCTPQTWRTSSCAFNGLLGQENYYSRKSFSDEYSKGNYSYDIIQRDVRVKNSNGDFKGDNGFFMSHYFANPNRIVLSGDSLLVASDERFSDKSTRPSINMRSRIMVFKTNPLSGISPICTGSNFQEAGKCQADYSIGQTSFGELITLNSSDEFYENIPYSLTDVDFTANGTTLFGIDREMNRVYVWKDYTDYQQGSGVPYDYYASNPMGGQDTSELNNGRYLPNLVNLNDIIFDPSAGFLYIEDSQLGKVFQIPLESSI